MAVPEPRQGWSFLTRIFSITNTVPAGKKAVKDRPCVIILSLEKPTKGITMVRVVPVTHSPPDDPSVSVELPPAVKRHLGLDDDHSWVILDEVNEFAWPGFDLRPVPGSHDRFAYGLLPPRLFVQIMTKLTAVWSERQGKTIPRD